MRAEGVDKWRDFPSCEVLGDSSAVAEDQSTWRTVAVLRLTDRQGRPAHRAVPGWTNEHGFQFLIQPIDLVQEGDLAGCFGMKRGPGFVRLLALANVDCLQHLGYTLELVTIVDIDDPAYAELPLV